MPAPTRRSKKERELYPHDNTRSRVTDNETVIKLEPPPRIADHPEKLDCWNYICNDLASRQVLSPSYIMPITMLVDNIVMYNEIVQALEESGLTIPILSKDGNAIVGYKENHLFGMKIRTEAAINKQCEKFGLNPRDAVFTTNPDIKTKPIEALGSEKPKGITYFSDGGK